MLKKELTDFDVRVIEQCSQPPSSWSDRELARLLKVPARLVRRC